MNDPFALNLQQHHDALGEFMTLLESEQSLFTDAPVAVDALSRLTERKAAQAKALEQLDGQRRALLAERGYDTDRDGARRLAATLDCEALWQALLTRIEAVRAQNQINGLAIETRLDHTNRTLAFLQRATGQTLYGPNGRTRAFGSNHSLRSGV
ncbi:FlgN protein [Salinisphaera sp. T5B8]|uniref:flagella synthesis protein FlgN n=1 Tax=Salinisphaera sp. T5B8 TaxID=1304154 RepID=UPI00334219E9